MVKSKETKKAPTDANETFKYSKEANENKRNKRQSSGQKQFPNSKSVCTLYLRADPLIYKTIYDHEGGKVTYKRFLF